MRSRIFVVCLVAVAFLSGYCLQSQPSPSAPAAIFDHYAFPVSDIPRSVAFYHEVLGLNRTPDPFHNATSAWMALNDHDQLHFIGGAQPQPPQSSDVHLAFRVASISDMQQRLDQAHIPYQNADGAPSKVTLRPDNVHQLYFQDPDGYWIEVNDRK